MLNEKPYADFMFMGINSFIDGLKKASTEFKIINDENTEKLFTETGSIFNKKTDTITVGYASRDGKAFYFLEFGIRLSPNVISYIVFLFNNRPSFEDIKTASIDIEPLVTEYLKGINHQYPVQ